MWAQCREEAVATRWATPHTTWRISGRPAAPRGAWWWTLGSGTTPCLSTRQGNPATQRTRTTRIYSVRGPETRQCRCCTADERSWPLRKDGSCSSQQDSKRAPRSLLKQETNERCEHD